MSSKCCRTFTRSMKSSGSEIRNVSAVKARFCIVDGREVAFSLLDDAKAVPSYDVGVWVNTEFFAGALQIMFENVWNVAKELTVKVKN